MSKQIQVILFSKSSPKSYVVEFTNKDTVATLKEKLLKKYALNESKLNLILCGKILNEDATLEDLFLSPLTYLTATIQSDTSMNEDSTKSTASDSTYSSENGSFYVFCKSCSIMNSGKLRIYCVECKSSAIILDREPARWSDVLQGNKLFGNCKLCDGNRPASVVFKCVKCGEQSPPLPNIKRNRSTNECVICGDNIENLGVAMDCQHWSCLDCSTAYLEQVLKQWLFVMKPSIGFTSSCPVFGCPGFITDVHHFYLLGVDQYKRYQKTAAEKFLLLQSERQYCPYADCGAAFMIDQVESGNDSLISCPECARLYCSICHSTEKCQCNNRMIDDESIQMIKKLSKPCPKCGAPTEKDGGCAHIHCYQCKEDWCFNCLKPWSDKCQWDHWFD